MKNDTFSCACWPLWPAGPGGSCGISPGSTSAKPVIYLYPEEETTVSVQLDYTGQLTTTYPAYGGRLDRHRPS